jgi:hypothetical protein
MRRENFIETFGLPDPRTTGNWRRIIARMAMISIRIIAAKSVAPQFPLSGAEVDEEFSLAVAELSHEVRSVSEMRRLL